MKVIAINGSARKEGNTFFALEHMRDIFEEKNIELEIIHVGGLTLKGCMACNSCFKTRKCIIDDGVNEIINKMREADGIILASPVYYSGISGTMKTFLDRAFYTLGQDLYHKVSGTVVAVRRSGGVSTYDQLNHYLNYCQTFMATSNYWTVIHGNRPNEIEGDLEGLQTLRVLARNMAYLMEVLSKSDVEKPITEKKAWTSFIR